MNKTSPHLLIDADMLTYTMGYASETKHTFFDGTSFNTANLATAKRLIKRAIQSYLGLFPGASYQLILSGSANWRFKLYPEYKANRATLVKPVYYKEIREWLQTLKECVLISDGDEADDYCAAMITAYRLAAGDYIECIAVTGDKDFFTIPGKIYHLSSRRLYSPTVSQSFSFLFFQGMAGDRVDGYYGVPWMGATKAKRLLVAAAGQKLTVRQTYLFLKDQIQVKYGKEAWKSFRLCIDLAALRWYDEEGVRGIGLRRVRKYRHLLFSYFLPYYDLSHNLEFGTELC